MTGKLERKISNISVAKLRNSARHPAPAMTCILRLDLEYFSSQSSTPRLLQRLLRYITQTPVTIAGTSWPIEITLTNRGNMRFKMLLGRTAMKGKLPVDPGSSFLLGRPPKKLR